MHTAGREGRPEGSGSPGVGRGHSCSAGAGQRAPGASHEDLTGASSGSARGSLGGAGAGAGKSGSVAWLQASSRSSGQRRTAEAGPGACPRTWPGQVLGTEEGFCTGWHRGQVPAVGDLRQRDLLHCCPDICYRYAAVFVFFHSTAIHSIWPGWISGARLHGRSSIEGLEYNQEAADHSL